MGRPTTRLDSVQHIAIKVHDIEAAVKFYTEVLGLTVSERHDPREIYHSPYGMCFLRCRTNHHDINLVYFPREAGLEPRPNSRSLPEVGLHHLAFKVGSKAEFDAWLAHIRSADIAITHGPVVHSLTHPEGDGTWGENRSFYFCDPSGNAIEILCDMGQVEEETNRINADWFRDRLVRDGHPPEAAEPPPAWTGSGSPLLRARPS